MGLMMDATLRPLALRLPPRLWLRVLLLMETNKKDQSEQNGRPYMAWHGVAISMYLCRSADRPGRMGEEVRRSRSKLRLRRRRCSRDLLWVDDSGLASAR